MRQSQLRAFDAVAREGSFSKAAKRLKLTQPAVTIQVRALEDTYGVKLFDRAGGGTALTGVGRSLFDLTRRLQDVEEQIREMLGAHRDLRAGELRIAADGPFVAMDLIAAFVRRYPGIQVRVALGNATEVKRALQEGRADVVVVAGAEDDKHIKAVPVIAPRLVALVARRHALAGTASIRLENLRDQPLIFREEESNTQRFVDRAFSEAGITPRAILRLGSREAVREAVAAGLGIGFVFEHETGEDGRVRALPLADVGLCSPHAAACLQNQCERRVVKAFMAIAAESASA